jgi:hypothetical protein
MRRRSTATVHPIGCACRSCAPRPCRDRRFELAIKGATRALFLIAALIAIPFIIAHALASAKGDNR